MTVYSIGLLQGYLPNGVDNAQGYRERFFDDLELNNYYIFFDAPIRKYIYYYESLGIPHNKMISPYHYFTKRGHVSLNDSKDEILDRIKQTIHYDEIHIEDDYITLYYKNKRILVIMLDDYNKDYVERVLYYKDECLIRTEYYLGGLFYAEMYETRKNNDGSLYAKKIKRTYYMIDGRVAFEVLCINGKTYNCFPDGRKMSDYELLNEYFKALKFSEKDILIVDRPGNQMFAQALFENKNDSKLLCVLHSEHYFEVNQDPQTALYLNYEYYYWYKCSKYIDKFIVSTQEQKECLIKNLEENQSFIPDVAVIPVGYKLHIEEQDKARKDNTLITVSRLDGRKRLDLIIKSVVKAHIQNTKIKLDIYGKGTEQYTLFLHNLVNELNALDFINFKGHVNVNDLYVDYPAYITASMWETFGLTLLEACSSGCAFIGLDVRYGNRLFIEDEKNGYLIKYDYVHDENYDDYITDEMSKKILRLFEDKERLHRFNLHSYEISKRFTYDEVLQLWKSLICDL